MNKFPVAENYNLMRFLLFFCFILLLTNSSTAKALPPTNVTVTIQASNGMTEADMTMEMLAGFEEWTKTSFLENSKKSFIKQGYSEDQYDGRAISTSHYVMREGKKLGVVEVSVSLKSTGETVMKMVRVFGFVDDGIATVGCLRVSDESIPITFGVCGEKVKEIFVLGAQ